MADDADLIGAIYDCIIDPSAWGDVVKRIVDKTKSVSGGISLHAPEAQLAALHNVDPSYAEAYVQNFSKIDALTATISTIVPGEVRAGTYITQTDSYRDSAVYNEYLRPQGWADVVAIGLLRSANATGLLSLQRTYDSIWIAPEEWHLLETLAPHLKRAAEIHQLLARTRAITDSLATTVAAAGFAVFILGAGCRVVLANSKAEDLLRRGAGLCCERGQLVATTPSVTQRLHALTRKAERPAQASGDIAGTIELPRGEDCPPLVAHVIPLAANQAVTVFDFSRPAAALFVVDPVANFDSAAQRFAGRFGLTRGETRVLLELIRGNGLLAAATRLNITEATARTHAKRIFAKTETRRQSELVRRFFEMSPAGSS